MNILIDGQTLHTAEINRGIGTYYKEIIEAMLRNDFVNSFYITIDDENKLDCFSEYTQNKLLPLIEQSYNPLYLMSENADEAHKKYSLIINTVCTHTYIDVYWNANPLMDNILLAEKKCEAKFTCTIHDLIPYVMQGTYFKIWNENIVKAYKDKLRILENYDLLFPVSNYTKNDIEKHLGIDTRKQIVTLEGVDSRFKPYIFPTIVTSEQYILYIGGFDPRKNMFRAIDAFSLFIKKYNNEKIDYKLYLVCTLDENARNELHTYGKEKDILEHLVLTGFLEDKELLNIYQKARCFFFPSLYEGFGLPILEALASGLPVASANNSSLPEVAGEYATYFDAYDIEEMALSLRETLNKSVSIEDRTARYQYASQFKWDKPACILLDGMLNLDKRVSDLKWRKIAWVSPLPPQRSGISNYSRLLLLAIKNHADIDIYYDGVLPENRLKTLFNVFPIEKLAGKFDDYDEVIYHLGNNSEFHENIYKYAWNYPSTVVIHDWNIHPFMQHSFLHTNNHSYYENAIREYGYDGVKELESINDKGYPDVWRFSMSDAIAKRSKRVIVHHQWVKNQLLDTSNVEVIPHFSYIEKIPSQTEIEKLRKKNKLTKEFVICTFGDINENKLPYIQICAIKTIIDEGYPIRLIFAGKSQPNTDIFFDKLHGTLYEDKIIVTGYLSEGEYFKWLYLSDLVINLRNPSMGEASGTLMQALFAEKPVIIGDLNQYKEFPDAIVAGKVKYNGNEIKQIVDIIKEMLGNRNKSEEIKKMAKEYSNSTLDINEIIKRYLGK